MEAEQSFQVTPFACMNGENTLKKAAAFWYLDSEDLGLGPDAITRANI